MDPIAPGFAKKVEIWTCHVCGKHILIKKQTLCMINQACLQPNMTHGHPFGMSGLKVYCQFTSGISPSNNTGSILHPVLFTIFITNLSKDTEGIITTQTDVRKLGRGLAGSKFRVIFAGWKKEENKQANVGQNGGMRPLRLLFRLISGEFRGLIRPTSV